MIRILADGVEYRCLADGEIIQAGDMMMTQNMIFPVGKYFHGSEIMEKDMSCLLRPVKPNKEEIPTERKLEI